MSPILKKLAGICCLMMLLLAGINKVQAQTGPGIVVKTVLDGAKGQLAKDSSVTVEDSDYFDEALRSKLDTPYPVRNTVTLKINEYSTLFLGAAFTATAHVRITYTTPQLQEETIEQELVINYDTANSYAMRNSFVFANAHKVKVQILDISADAAINVLPALMIENAIELYPVYKWSCTENAVQGFDPVTAPNTDSTDELLVTWDAATGADVYDLEWAYVDSSALARYGSPVNPDLIFAYNTTRVTIAANTYRIPLLYDDGGILYYRVRAVQEKGNNRRMESVWSTYFQGGLGAYSFVGHQRLLNWQSSIAYAEDGKRKVTVQYYDGSLRSRQTVTKDNTTDTTIVAETEYDYQGRPAIQVLPAPTLSNVIKYTRNLNRDINGAEYDKDHYDYIATPRDYLTASAAPMDTASGANRYYSSLNPDKNNGLNKYIPKAEGFAFTETQYTQDNTGRIAKQGGVGPTYKIGSEHETKYYYGSAAQEDLYALFGTEAGEAAHYFKNMVSDANGQSAITYLDMHGRTVATSLIGSPENNSLSDLPGKETITVTDSLSGPGKNTLRDLVMESKQSLLVAESKKLYDFTYVLPRPVLKKPDCDGNIVCYAGVYDLEIRITDDVYNQHLPGGKPFVISFHNYNGGDILPNCTPKSDTLTFKLELDKGNYEITKALSVNREAMDYYRDSLFLTSNVCTSLEEEIEKQKVLQRTVGCYPDCASCKANLGSWDDFRVKYVLNAGNNIADTALFRDEAFMAYQQAIETCKSLCNEVSEADETRALMLQDISAPSGQYANPAMDSLNTFSIFYKANPEATPKYQQNDIVYLDETGKPDLVYDDMAGVYVKPQQLSKEQFGAMFKPSWAQALLKFHPEYCKLVEYEKYTASNLWDRRMEKIDSYQQAKDSGYLNPAGNINLFPANNIDPFLNQLSAAQRQAMINKLNAYVQNSSTSYSMWSVATISIKCGKEDNINCSNLYNTTEKAFDQHMLCAGDLDMAWRAFRQSYQREKRLMMESLMPTNCASESAITTALKIPRFPTTNGAYANSGLGNIPTDKNLAEQYADGQLQQLIYDNCHSYVEYWVHQLAPCYGEALVRNELAPQLEYVCREGGDLQHPRGSSTVRPTSTYQYRSFEEVIAAFNATHPHPDDKYLCNAERLAIPQPYDKQTAYIDNIGYTKPTDCECNNLSGLQREYQALKKPQDTTFAAYLFRTRNVKVAQSNLDLLLDACTASSGSCSWLPKPVTIPAFIQCNVAPPCATCVEVQSVYSAFTIAYPGVDPVIGDVDSVQQLKNELFANFMNNRLGFSKSAWEYKSFLDSCEHVPATPGVQVCKPANQNAKAYSYDNGGASVITDIHRTTDNGYILAGSTTGYSHGGKDAYVIKTDSRGEVIWSKTYGAEQDDEFVRIAPTQDGGYVGIGTTYSYCYDQGAMLIIKLDADGTMVWNKAAEFAGRGGKGTDIIQTQDSDLAFAGLSTNNGVGAEWIMGVLSPEGDMRWMKQISSPGEKKPMALMENPLFYDENATELLAVTSLKAQNDYNVVMIALDKAQGYKTRNSQVYDIDQGDNIATGISPGIGLNTKVIVENVPGTTTASIMAMDLELGEYAVQRVNKISLPGTLVGQTAGIYATTDKGSYLAQTVANPLQDVYWHKLDEYNRLQWSNRIKISGNERLHRILVNPDGTLAGAGVYNNQAALLMLAASDARVGCDSALTVPGQDAAYSGPFFLDTPTDILLGTNCFSTVVIGETACNLTRTLVSCPMSDSCYTVKAGPLLCGNAQAVFSPAAPNESSACSDSTYFATSAGTVKYNAYIDSVKNDFEESYKTAVLQAKDMEKFAVTYSTSEYHYTLYYYDQAGNLVKTVPPAGVVKDRSDTWINQVKAAKAAGNALVPAHRMVTNYRYNTLNQVVGQKTPDAGRSRFWYDRLGRLAVSQNAKQALTQAYSYTIYDALGRITEVGEISSSTPMTDAISRNETSLANWINGAAANKREITRTVYDLPYEAFTGKKLLDASNLRNRVSWTAIYDNAAALDTNGYAAATFYSYDIHGNVDTLLQDFKLGTMRDKGNRWKKIVYNYDLVSGKVNMVAYQPGQKDAFYHRYTYDAENRITNVQTSHDSVYWENDAFYQYYKHGPLARAVIGQQQVQGLDYAYTLQGWLKGVNSTSLGSGADIGGDGANGGITARDAFGFSLNYFGDNDYKPINATVKPFASVTPSGSAFKPLYNGNIGAMSVNVPKVGVPMLYQYSYDALNRIVGMDAQHGLDAATNTWTPVTTTDFAERLTYDANGNILRYKRNGNHTWAGKPEFMDSLTYHYEPGRNRLNFIRDTVDGAEYDVDIDSQSPDNYAYDSIGNMIKDVAGNIRSIEWTVYGKIRRIVKTNNDTITYTYDPAGNRISKRMKGMETWYVRDASGNVMSVYVKGDNSVNSGALSQTEVHLYGSSRLGISTRVTNMEDTTAPAPVDLEGLGTGANINFKRDNKFFELGNHLGNVLATVSDHKQAVSVDGNTVDHYEADVVSEQDYYPFGMMQPGRNISAASYRYGFNGKENDNDVKGEGNQQDYGKRIYDPRAGKFLSVDPITSDYPELTPYQFASNRPIDGIDLDGLEFLEFKNKNRSLLVANDEAAVKDFKSAYCAAYDANLDIVNVNSISDLNKYLQEKKKVYNNIFIFGHGGISVGYKSVALLVGKTWYYKSYLKKDELQILGSFIKPNGLLFTMGCFTAKQEGFDGKELMTTLSEMTNRTVIGDRAETMLGPNTFKNRNLGAMDMRFNLRESFRSFYFYAYQSAGVWSLAQPDGSYDDNIGNVKIDQNGNVSSTAYGTSVDQNTSSENDERFYRREDQ